MEIRVLKKKESEEISTIFEAFSKMEEHERMAILHFLTGIMLDEQGCGMIAGLTGKNWTVLMQGKIAELMKKIAEKKEKGFEAFLETVLESC